MSIIEIKPVTKDNYASILALRVSKNQKSFIETPEQCLRDSEDCQYYQPVGLYYSNALVGFTMYGLFPEYDESNVNGRVWLDRFFIDERFQGKGIGSLMLKTLIQHLVELYKGKRIFLSIYDTNTRALRLYKKFGFQYNGELDINGEKVMVLEIERKEAVK